jgi:hypothetical protein
MKTMQDFLGIPADTIDSDMVLAFAQMLARSQLGIEMPKRFHVFPTVSISTCYIPDTDIVVINTLDIDRAHPFELVAHEMRHVWQVKMGVLSYENGIPHWKGKATRIADPFFEWNDYISSPWEMDANMFAYKICKELFVPFFDEDVVWTGTTSALNMTSLWNLVKSTLQRRA